MPLTLTFLTTLRPKIVQNSKHIDFKVQEEKRVKLKPGVFCSKAALVRAGRRGEHGLDRGFTKKSL